MGIKVANNAFATLASGISNSATSITLTTGQGARFPSLGAGDYFYATLVDTSNNLEIVKCTARSTDVLTVVRAQESTTARAYSAGDRIEIRLTAATFTDATQALPTQTGNAGKYLKTDGTNATWETVSVTPTAISDQTNSSTGYFDLPAGTTAQRPGSPNAGMVRFNTTTGEPEWYDPGGSGQWLGFSKGANYLVEYLVVAGGGGGGRYGGGGGAGGYLASTLTVTALGTYSVTVGAGGAGWVGDAQSGGNAGNGTNSNFSTSTSIGGGGAGNYGNPTGSGGASGGSGGGAGISNTSGGLSGGSGTAGQGNNGGSSPGGVSSPGGGGGGAGATGTSGSSTGKGGDGSTWLNGSTYAGGGSGSQPSTNLAGGSGGGGTGFTTGTRTSAIDGVANTGGGGGGGRDNSPSAGNGGSGVVIIRYPGSQRGAGGTVTQTGGYTYHTFTSSGTYTA